MIRRPIKDYFFFGTAVRYLQDAKPGHLIANSGTSWRMRTNLQQLFEYLDSLDLRVTSRTDSAGRLRALLTEFEGSSDDATLTAEQALQLTTKVTELRETLEAELAGVNAYTLTPKRFASALLLENPGGLLAPGAFGRLPSIAQSDFREAALCIAYERPTAAAFHLMRATESGLRAFYASLVRRGRTARMWAEIVSDLQKRRRIAATHAALLSHLDHIRRSFRNPTQHPEATYDIHEVQDLMGLCIDAINRMAPVLA